MDQSGRYNGHESCTLYSMCIIIYYNCMVYIQNSQMSMRNAVMNWKEVMLELENEKNDK